MPWEVGHAAQLMKFDERHKSDYAELLVTLT